MDLFGKFRNALGNGLTNLGGAVKKVGEVTKNIGESIGKKIENFIEDFVPPQAPPVSPIDEVTPADEALQEEQFQDAIEEDQNKGYTPPPPGYAYGVGDDSGSPDDDEAEFSPAPATNDRAGDPFADGYQPQPFYFDDDVEEWLATGSMKIAYMSNNVYGFSYDRRRQSLYIQFLHWQPGMHKMKNSGPGATYRYDNVPEDKARDLFINWELAGEWIWDYLRVRQTWSMHQYPYSLVRVEREYVPRKAVIDNSEPLGEFFVTRGLVQDGEHRYSTLDEGPVHRLSQYTRMRAKYESKWGSPDRGHPL